MVISMNYKVLIPLIIIVLAYITFFARDIITRRKTEHFPKWVWMIICLISMPAGGIVYYIFGRVPESQQSGMQDE